jgi:hypothetical protein
MCGCGTHSSPGLNGLNKMKQEMIRGPSVCVHTLGWLMAAQIGSRQFSLGVG